MMKNGRFRSISGQMYVKNSTLPTGFDTFTRDFFVIHAKKTAMRRSMSNSTGSPHILVRSGVPINTSRGSRSSSRGGRSSSPAANPYTTGEAAGGSARHRGHILHYLSESSSDLSESLSDLSESSSDLSKSSGFALAGVGFALAGVGFRAFSRAVCAGGICP